MSAILWHEDIEINGSRYSRGTKPIQGYNTPEVGYRLSCSLCDWDRRVNGNLKVARPIGRAHAREEHGIKGLEDDYF